MRIRTDLVLESNEIYNESKEREISGVKIVEKNIKGFKSTLIEIIDKNGENALRKPIGSYLTLEMDSDIFYDANQMDEISKALGISLRDIGEDSYIKNALIVGLGNWNITPDALGPKVTENIMVTRHIKENTVNQIDSEINSVCAVSPGVLGITGIETLEIIKGIVEKVKPSVVICIDALAARDVSRVNSTIQITNTGISPGSGVQNKRSEISQKTLGVPVIAIGVPTVVDSATIARDAIDLIVKEFSKISGENSGIFEIIQELEEDELENIIMDIMNSKGKNFVSTPKDIDLAIESLAKIIANGINLYLQPSLELNEINMFL